MKNDNVPTATLPGIADKMSVASGKLFKASSRLICIQGSGKVVTNSPPAPPTPNIEIMMLMEVDTYLRAVSEADTADKAVALWRPDLQSRASSRGSNRSPSMAKGDEEASMGKAMEENAVTVVTRRLRWWSWRLQIQRTSTNRCQ